MTYELDEAYFLDLLGDACNVLGRYDKAVDALSKAVAVFKEHGAQCAYAVGLFKLAQSHLALDDRHRAVGCLEECLPIFDALQLPASAERARTALDACLLTALGSR
ncbi:MAG TPA: tetratricopeptide repeat protein [Streptosporangiaceae bacterium]|nr:tetratricopeptide repeat protein [Streptosporangiaceae bacterium]